MQVRTRTEIGILFLAVALGLMLVTTLATDVLFMGDVAWAPGLSLSDRALVWATLFLAVPIAAIVIGVIGFSEIWRGQSGSERGPSRALSLARLAGVVGFVAVGALTATGLVLGLVYLPALADSARIGRSVVRPLGAVAIGLFLLWAVRDATSRGAARLSIAALGSGVVATSLFVVLDTAGELELPVLVFWAERITATASVALWLLVYLTALRRVRAGDTTRAGSATPT